MSMARPRIAALYPYDPTSLARIRSLDTLKALTLMGDVTVYAPDLTRDAVSALGAMGCAAVTVRDTRWKRTVRIAEALLLGRSITFAYYLPVMPAGHEWRRFDLVFSERCPVPRSTDLPPLVVDIVDNFEKQVHQLARTAKPPRRYGYVYDTQVIRRDILRLCENAQTILCTTPAEAAGLTAIGVPAVKLLAYLHLSQVNAAPTDDVARAVAQSQAPRAVFHGRANYAANKAAVDRLKELAELVPNWNFLVFGEGWVPGKSGHLEYLGFQEDLRMLNHCALGIYPVEVAVGVQNKVLEALSVGLPVLVTPQVHEGLPAAIKKALRERIEVREIGEFAAVLNESKVYERSDDAARIFKAAYAEVINDAREALTRTLSPLLKLSANRNRADAR